MEQKSVVRSRRSREEWRVLVDRQAESGMTARRFCEVEGISESYVHQWRRRLSPGHGVGSFLEVTSEMLQSGRVRAELDLGNGVVFRIFR